MKHPGRDYPMEQPGWN